jgi:hypothetical protein
VVRERERELTGSRACHPASRQRLAKRAVIIDEHTPITESHRVETRDERAFKRENEREKEKETTHSTFCINEALEGSYYSYY